MKLQCLHAKKRIGNTATLEVSARDQQDQKLYLVRNEKTLLWDLNRAETGLWKTPLEPILEEMQKTCKAVTQRNPLKPFVNL